MSYQARQKGARRPLEHITRNESGLTLIGRGVNGPGNGGGGCKACTAVRLSPLSVKDKQTGIKLETGDESAERAERAEQADKSKGEVSDQEQLLVRD